MDKSWKCLERVQVSDFSNYLKSTVPVFSMPLNENYPVKYNDTTEIFKYIINVATNNTQFVKNFRILIYNGDVRFKHLSIFNCNHRNCFQVDTVCNFLGDSWHIDNIASQMNLTVISFLIL